MRILREGLADGKAGELFKAKELAVAARNAANMVAQQAFATAFEACAAVGSMPAFNWALIDQAIEKRVADLIAEKVSLTQLQQDGQRLQLEKRVKQLRALQWLFQISPSASVWSQWIC
ncbi:hypothetical protein [Kosakonia arachidis]|uniref:hypothetical protein n=1 Tax=Kosakonia arachidis TaxID=551989 RepID=UPI0015870E30|nr:hypothetical protein [Kosakonia arachidis]